MSEITASTDSKRAFDFVRSCDGEFGGAEPPPPGTCKHCGATLYWRGLMMNGVVSHWWFVEPCECAEAQRERLENEKRAAEEKRIADEAAERRRKQERIDRMIGQSGIGRRFQMRTFDNFVCTTDGQRKCFEIAKEYADGFKAHAQIGEGLFFAGTVGTGKTHLAAAIAIKLLNDGVPVIFRTGIDVFADIRKAYDGGRVSESDITETYKTVDLLVIDDLGKEKMTEWAASMLFGIINARYEKMLPTIITTNLDTEALRRTLGDEQTRAQAIISRLQETSIVVTMVWSDYRRN